MFNKRDRRCAAVQLTNSTDPTYDSQNHHWIATNIRVMKSRFPASAGSLVWFQVMTISCYLTSSKSAWKSTPKCTWMCGDPLVQSGGRWQTLSVAAGLGAGPQVQRDPGLASEGVLRLCTLLSLAPPTPDLNPLDYFVWSYVENIINITSHNIKVSLTAAIHRLFADIPPAVVEKACSQFRIRIEAVIEAEGGYME